MAKIHWRGGVTAQKKCVLGGGNTAHTFLMGGTIGWGGNIYWEGRTPHHRTYFFDGRNNCGGDTGQLSSIIKIPTKPLLKFVEYQISKLRWWVVWVDGLMGIYRPHPSCKLELTRFSV